MQQPHRAAAGSPRSRSPRTHRDPRAEAAEVATLRLHPHRLKTRLSPLQLRVEMAALAQVWEQASRATPPLLQLPQLKYSKILQVVIVPWEMLPGEPSGSQIVRGD